MEQSSQLEALLRAEVGEAVKDSSGAFTISREKALEKLAAFRLPRDSAWTLKIVQAAVASGCSQLDIRQTGTATEFHLSGPTGWTLDQVESEFYRVESCSETSLEYLKHGLWSASLNSGRPFSLAAPDWPEALLWKGDRLLRKSVPPVRETVLTVSHRGIVEAPGASRLARYEGFSRNRELAAHAFTCPRPLFLDKRRIDALQICDRHGLSGSSYPIQMGFIEAELPQLTIPAGTFSGFSHPREADSSMSKLLRGPASIPPRASLACVVSAHLRKTVKSNTARWETFVDESLIYWVRDGVVVDRTPPTVKSSACCSLAIYASADKLASDASGLSLIQDEAFRQAEAEVSRLGALFLQEVQLDTSAMLAAAQARTRLIGGAMVAGGLGSSFLSLPHGLLLAVGGAATMLVAGKIEKVVIPELVDGLNELKNQWRTQHGQVC